MDIQKYGPLLLPAILVLFQPYLTAAIRKQIGNNTITINSTLSDFELQGIVSSAPVWQSKRNQYIQRTITTFSQHLKTVDRSNLDSQQKTILSALQNCTTLCDHTVDTSHGFTKLKCEYPSLFIHIIQQHLNNNPHLNARVVLIIHDNAISMSTYIPAAQVPSHSSDQATQKSTSNIHPIIGTVIVGISCIVVYYWYTKNQEKLSKHEVEINDEL
jgi:hypothetical protein